MKSGLDYFATETQPGIDEMVIFAEFGAEGMGVMYLVYRYIYGIEGYYMRWTKRERLLLSAETHLPAERLENIIKRCVEEGIFNKELFDKYSILTSEMIQTRFLYAVKRRKNITVIREYLLVCIQDADNVLTECIHDANISGQSKVKESKVKESKVNNKKEDADAVVEAEAKKGLYEEVYGEVNRRAEEQLEKYTDSMDRELILHVLTLAFIDKKPWRWVIKVLDTHVRDGTRTVEGFEKKADRMSKETKQHKTAYPEYGSTNNYDIEEMERRALERRMKKADCNFDKG